MIPNGNSKQMSEANILDVSKLGSDDNRYLMTELDLSYDLMKRLEGVKGKAYFDTEGNVTVGCGFNMDSLFAKTIWDTLDIKEDFALVYNGMSEITDESSEKLFEYFWDSSLIEAESRCKQIDVNWNALPFWHRFILADIAYNTGNVKGWTKVFTETDPNRVLFEARRKQREIDSRVAKIGKYFNIIDTLKDAHNIGLTGAKYIA